MMQISEKTSFTKSKMRSYLSLIPISASVRRRQNRMTILCIVISVFLVTAIFSIADMMIRAESGFMLNKHGNWHIKLEHISGDIAEEIGEQAFVAAVGASSVFNFDGDEPYYIGEKKAVLYGTEEIYMDQIANGITEGSFPDSDDEVMLSPNAVIAFQAQIGDSVTLYTPAGSKTFTVSGFGTDDKSYYENQTYLIGLYMTRAAYTSLLEQNGVADAYPAFYVQFRDAAKAAEAVTEIQARYQLPEEWISENIGVMGMAGQSSNTSVNGFYDMAAILFVLVLLAGVLMISGSMNSNISGRTQFFGMLRCIGASRAQVIRFVRLEALNWCKTAVPVGVIGGTLASWAICAALRYGIGGEFSTTPIFAVSPTGLFSGAAVGIITVLLAAQSPARRAGRVSPISAVSGNSERKGSVRRAARAGLGRIECVLGIHHAAASRKSWCFMTASFAVSIVLFLCFSVVLDMARLLLPSEAPTSADMSLGGFGNAKVLERSLTERIREIEGVANAYGSCYTENVSVVSSREGIESIPMVSYDEALLDYAQGSVVKGNLDEVYGDSNKVATVFHKNNPLRVGDTVTIGGTELEIACELSQGLFGDDSIVICSQETYDRLMGKENYILIGVQLEKNAAEETAARIRSFESKEVVVLDHRENNRKTHTTYLASRLVAYGFLVMIGMITLCNIMNSISMSVSARIRQYGAMRAVGMDQGQLIRMISAEALTYAVSGLIAGYLAGIPLSRFLYTQLVTRHFGVAWSLSAGSACIVTAFVLACACAAVRAPAKRLRSMVITDTINEL